MAPAIESAAATLQDRVDFDLLLGGVNVDSTLPVGQYGLRLLTRIWQEVAATTGQRFSYRLPDGFVFNSVRPCLAVAAVRQALGRPPFGYLHLLQQRLFLDAVDINAPSELVAAAASLGVPAGVVQAALDAPEAAAALRAEFDGARRYGTQALPNVLIERDGRRRLLLGGYADAAMLVDGVLAALA
jgi:protein-disulfide isomerase-like protein with CxxC motif